MARAATKWPRSRDLCQPINGHHARWDSPAPRHAASATHLSSAAARQQNCCSQSQMTNYLRISIHHNALLERTHFQQNEGAFVVLGPERCTWSSDQVTWDAPDTTTTCQATLGCRGSDHTGCLRSWCHQSTDTKCSSAPSYIDLILGPGTHTPRLTFWDMKMATEWWNIFSDSAPTMILSNHPKQKQTNIKD